MLTFRKQSGSQRTVVRPALALARRFDCQKAVEMNFSPGANTGISRYDCIHAHPGSRPERCRRGGMEDRNRPVDRTCTHCGVPGAKLMPTLGDYDEYQCPKCGTYRIT